MMHCCWKKAFQRHDGRHCIPIAFDLKMFCIGMHSLFRFFPKWEVKPMRKLCYSLIFQRYYPSQSVKEVFESKKDGFASFFMELCQMICFTCSFPMHCAFPEKGNACLNQQILSLLWEKRQCLSRKGRSLSWKRNYISLKRQCLLEKRYSLAWKRH